MEKENLEKNQEDQTPEDNSNVSNETPKKMDNSQKDENSETYKKRYSDSSREAKRLNQVHTEYRNVLKENSRLLELDEITGRAIVKQLHEDGFATTDSYEDIIKAIKSGETEEESSSKIDEEALTKRIREKILDEQREEKSQEVLNDALSKFDEKTREKYLSEFKDVAGKRKLTPEFVKKEMDKIIIYYNKDKNKRSDETFSKIASSGIGNSKSKSVTSMTISKLDTMGVPKDRQKLLYPELFTK